MRDNIFTSKGQMEDLVDTFYNLLIARGEVSYEDVLTKYDGGTLSAPSVSNHPLYTTLKKVVPEVVEAIRKKGYEVRQIIEGRTTKYQYVGTEDNPLKHIKFKALILERYNDIDKCIKDKQPVKITYSPFDRESKEIVFHPHLLYAYNNRYFAFGVSEMEGKRPFRKFCIALDRINGKICYSTNTYIPPEKGEYDYLAHLVGVRFENGAELTTIRIRALDAYTFGRLTTKPLHDSQKTVVDFSSQDNKGYGEVEIKVYPNVELLGQILSYGSYLQIISPESFRERVVHELKKALQLYENGSLT